MKSKRLGGGELEVSVIGLGCMVLPGFCGPGSQEQAIRTLHRAAEIGVTFLDSSDLYGAGQNEELIGRAIDGRRDDYIIATKFGNVRTADGKAGIDGRPEYVRQACEASLTRLGIDVIDLYYQHRVDPTVPIEDTVGAMARLIEQGKVRCLGLSEAAPATIRRAAAVHPIAAVQSEYSLLYRLPAEETLPVCRELNIAFVAYAPLGRSLLTGAVAALSDIPDGDRRRDHPRFQQENLAQNLELVRRIEAIAAELGARPSQLVLAWLLAQGEEIIALPGTKRLACLTENLGALNVRLDSAVLARIDSAVPAGAAAGARYPEAQMRAVHI